MKIIKLFLVMAGLCLAGSASAQRNYRVGSTIDGPSHPLKPAFGLPRILADTVIGNTYKENGKDQSMFPIWVLVYKFNENHRIDTLYGPNYATILKYSEKDQLLSVSDYAPGYVSESTGAYIEPWEVLDVEFEYGEDGRLIKEIDYKLGEGGSSVDSVYTYHYAMTDSGYYIVNDPLFEYILDDQGRLVCRKDLSRKDEYVIDPEGRRFRKGDVYFFYFENGYSLLSYDYRRIDLVVARDAWLKMDYFFQEHGFLSEQIDYLKKEGETEWTVYNHDTWRYYYRDGNPLANNPVVEERLAVSVYASAGAVVVEAEESATVGVYSFNGQLVTQRRISAGANRIALPPGTYIIAVNGQGYKVAVR